MANGSACIGLCPMVRCDDEGGYVLFLIPSWKTTPPYMIAPEIEEEVRAIVVFNHYQEGVLLTGALWQFSPELPKKRVFVTDINKPYNYAPGYSQAQMRELDAVIKVHQLPDHFICRDVDIFLDTKSRSFVKTIQKGDPEGAIYEGYVGTNIEIETEQKECSFIYGSIAKSSLNKAAELWTEDKAYIHIYLIDNIIQGNTVEDFKVFKPKKQDPLPYRNGVMNPELM